MLSKYNYKYSNTNNSIIIHILVQINTCSNTNISINIPTFEQILFCNNIIVQILFYNNMIILILVQILFCQFLENGNRYKAKIYNIY